MTGYNCTQCNTHHPFSLYIKSHLREDLRHICTVCGAVHSLRDGDVTRVTPRHLDGRTMPHTSMDQRPDQLCQLSIWYGVEVTPPHAGEYDVRLRGYNDHFLLWWDEAQWLARAPGGPWIHPVDRAGVAAWRGLVVM